MNLNTITLTLQKLRNWPSLHEANDHAAAALNKLPDGFCDSPDKCQLVVALVKIAIAEAPREVEAAVDEALQMRLPADVFCYYQFERGVIRILRPRLVQRHD
jgi:hypothetical protein